jgi:hypothetical protein
VPEIALYYPWMHFRDENWLKLALLTWDNIVRIRPKDVPDRDGDLVRQIRSETDMLTEIVPSPADLQVVTEAFVEAVRNYRERLVEQYGMTENGRRKRRSTGRRGWGGSNAGGEDFDTNSSWVYDGPGGPKMARKLRDMLLAADLAIADPEGRTWVGMSPGLGSVYSATLADVVARHNQLSPVTDNPWIHHAVGALDQLTELLLADGQRRPALQHADSAYMHIAIRAVIEPKRLADVPVAKLIKFRQRYSAELMAFREHVRGLAPEIERVAAVENIDVAHAHLTSLYQKATEPQLNELRRGLLGLGVESTAGAIGMRLDLNAAAGTVIGSAVSSGGPLVVAGTAAAVTFVPYIAGQIKAGRQRTRDSPVAYLLAADRKLSRLSLRHTLRADGVGRSAIGDGQDDLSRP